MNIYIYICTHIHIHKHIHIHTYIETRHGTTASMLPASGPDDFNLTDYELVSADEFPSRVILYMLVYYIVLW